MPKVFTIGGVGIFGTVEIDNIKPTAEPDTPVTFLRPALPFDGTKPTAEPDTPTIFLRPLAPADTVKPTAEPATPGTLNRPIQPSSGFYDPTYSEAEGWYSAKTLSTGSLATWPSASSSEDWTQSTTGDRPTVTANTINGFQGVVFDGSHMESASPQPIKAVMMVISDLSSGNNPIFSSGEGTPVQHMELIAGGVTDASLDGTGDQWGGLSVNGAEGVTVATSGDVAGSELSTGNAYIVYATFDKPQSFEFLGKVASSEGDFAIGEIIHWSRQPDYVEIEKIAGYLSNEWNISLVAGHPYESVQPPQVGLPTRSNTVANTTALINAIDNANAGDVIFLAPNTTYSFTSKENLAPMLEIVGAGLGSVIEGDNSWQPGFTGVESSPINEDFSSYLMGARTINSRKGSFGLSNCTLTAIHLHGVMHLSFTNYCHFHNLEVLDTGYAGIRDIRGVGNYCEGCIFTNAGKKKKETGGDYFGENVEETVIRNCLFQTISASTKHVGFKSDAGCRLVLIEQCEFTNAGFAIEVPHSNTDDGNEVRYCTLNGASSIPRHSGGGGQQYASDITRNNGTGEYEPVGGVLSWYFHHCMFDASYVLEGPRRSVMIQHSVLLDVRAGVDGNIISMYAGTSANEGYTSRGPNAICNSRIRVDRGLWWLNGTTSGAEKMTVGNCYIEKQAGTSDEGLIGQREDGVTDHASNLFIHNIVDLSAFPQPIYRTAAFAGTVENNSLTGVTDAGNYANPQDNTITKGPNTALDFQVGVNLRYQVNNWTRTLI